MYAEVVGPSVRYRANPTDVYHASNVIGHSVTGATRNEEIESIRDLIIARDGIIVVIGDFLGISGNEVTLTRDRVELPRDDDENIWQRVCAG